mmetsp:Transcript_99033/g.295856  ORF Transcript_99033/g.295856 Transcript_99033/m.295856 type:complete len:216 (+) Transcript_99033:392-1039(+)
MRGRARRSSAASISPLWSESKNRKALRSCLSDWPQKTARHKPQATSSEKPASLMLLSARPALRIWKGSKPRMFAVQAEDSAVRVDPVSLAAEPTARPMASMRSPAVERNASKARFASPGFGFIPRTKTQNSPKSRCPVWSASTRSKSSSTWFSSTCSPMSKSACRNSAMSIYLAPFTPSLVNSLKALRRSFSDWLPKRARHTAVVTSSLYPALLI